MAKAHDQPLKAVARFSDRRWKVRVDRPDGTPAGWFQSATLDSVVAKARDLVEDPAADVTVELVLPAEIDHNLQLAEQLVEEATHELQRGITKLRAAGIAAADIHYILGTRRLRLDPEPI